MRYLSAVVDIEALPELVWAVMRDIESWPTWTPTVTSIRRLDRGRRFGVGSRARVRQPSLRPAIWQVTDMDEGRSFTWVTHAPGVHVAARHSIGPSLTGSQVTLSITFSGLWGPLVARLLRRLNQRYLNAEALGLKWHCEAWARRQPRGACFL